MCLCVHVVSESNSKCVLFMQQMHSSHVSARRHRSSGRLFVKFAFVALSGQTASGAAG